MLQTKRITRSESKATATLEQELKSKKRKLDAAEAEYDAVLRQYNKLPAVKQRRREQDEKTRVECNRKQIEGWIHTIDANAVSATAMGQEAYEQQACFKWMREKASQCLLEPVKFDSVFEEISSGMGNHTTTFKYILHPEELTLSVKFDPNEGFMIESDETSSALDCSEVEELLNKVQPRGVSDQGHDYHIGGSWKDMRSDWWTGTLWEAYAQREEMLCDTSLDLIIGVAVFLVRFAHVIDWTDESYCTRTRS